MTLEPFPLSPIENSFVRLSPFDPSDQTEALQVAAEDPLTFRWLSIDASTPEGFKSLLDGMQRELTSFRRSQTGSVPWIVFDKHTEKIVGSTRYLNFDWINAGLEIGWTWYHPAAWAGPVNPSCKLLLLDHAFRVAGAERVALRCDARNERSYRAIQRLGAVEEGILRHERRRRDGSWRDTVTFSILAHEWPMVRDGLVRRLEAF